MASFMNTYFGPLPREYCVYFYALSIVFGFFFAFSILSILYFIIMHRNKLNVAFGANALMILTNTFLAYIANRLLHTMCVKSI